MRQQSSLARLLASAAMTAILAAGLGGCQTMSDITGSITSKAEASPSPDTDPHRSVDVYGERYRANPRDPDAALADTVGGLTFSAGLADYGTRLKAVFSNIP